MSESTPERKPRRTAAEIAQGHADKALAAVEKHDEKVNKLNDKIEGLQDQLAELRRQREELVAEADYRQAHPALRKAGDAQQELDFADESEPEENRLPEPESADDDDNPFA